MASCRMGYHSAFIELNNTKVSVCVPYNETMNPDVIIGIVFASVFGSMLLLVVGVGCWTMFCKSRRQPEYYGQQII